MTSHQDGRGSRSAADLLVKRPLNTQWGLWVESLYRVGNDDVIAVTLGSWTVTDVVPLRIHSTCFAAHYLGSTECDCREQLVETFEYIESTGTGVIVILDQDGRANGHAALMRAAQLAKRTDSTQSDAYAALGYPIDSRTYWQAAAVIDALGIRRIEFISNNPHKIDAVRSAGIEVTERSARVSFADDRGGEFYKHKTLEGYLNLGP